MERREGVLAIGTAAVNGPAAFINVDVRPTIRRFVSFGRAFCGTSFFPGYNEYAIICIAAELAVFVITGEE